MSVPVLAIGVATSAVLMIGCASTYDLELDLKASVEVYVGEFNGALWAKRALAGDDGTARTMSYALGEGCHFVLEMDSRSSIRESRRGYEPHAR